MMDLDAATTYYFWTVVGTSDGHIDDVNLQVLDADGTTVLATNDNSRAGAHGTYAMYTTTNAISDASIKVVPAIRTMRGSYQLYVSTSEPDLSTPPGGGGGGSDSCQAQGQFSIASDNAYALYINGEYRENVNGGITNVNGCADALNPMGDSYTGCNWQSVDQHNIDLTADSVVLAVDALDAGGTGGWIGTATVNGVEYTTSADWKCISGETHGQDGGWSQVNSDWHGDPAPDGWSMPGFDDSSWPAATEFGANGVGP